MRKKTEISAKQVVWTSFVIDVSDLVLNLIVAVMSGSVVILSQALQGAADLMTSFLLVVGVRQARRRSNRRHHFGYGRELYFWILMAAVSMVTITATFSCYFGILRMLHPEPISNLPYAYGVLIIGLVTNSYAFSLSYRRLNATKLGHSFWERVARSAHIETKATLILDAMGTVASVFGVLALLVYQTTGDLRFDGLGAILIGLFTAFLAIVLIIEVKDLLVGLSAAPEVENEIRQTVIRVVGVRRLLDLRTMYLGSDRILVNLEVHLEQNMRTAQIEQLMDEIKNRVKQQVPAVHHIQIELETPNKREALGE